MPFNAHATDRARRAVVLGQRAAADIEGTGLDTGWLLWGLWREERSRPTEPGLLAGEDLDDARLRARIERATPEHAESADHFSAAARASIERAVAVSDERVDFTVGVEHLLLGVLGDPEDRAVRSLVALGVDPDALTRRVRARLGADRSPRSQAAAGPVLSQLVEMRSTLGRIAARLEAIEARLVPGS